MKERNLAILAPRYDRGKLLMGFSHLCRINKDIVVRLKWGETEYRGKLISMDTYMNIQLSGAVEYIDSKKSGDLGEVLIRYVFWPHLPAIPFPTRG